MLVRLLVLFTSMALYSSESVHAFDTSGIEDPKVRACADRSIPQDTMRQTQMVKVVGGNGFVRESIREIFWRRFTQEDSRVLIRVLEPQRDRGLAVLINDHENEQFPKYSMYSPELKRVRRVTGESFFGSILGTDFTYEDFSYFYRVDEREKVTRIDDDTVDGHDAYVLETVKQVADSNYLTVRFYIDKHYCLPVRSDFIAVNGDLRKQLLVARDKIAKVDNHWVPFHTTMVDFKHGTRSEFIVEKIIINPELDASMFSNSALSRSR